MSKRIWIAFWALSAVWAAENGRVVSITGGQVRGRAENGGAVFKGTEDGAPYTRATVQAPPVRLEVAPRIRV